jgi:hypothetical protein
MPDPSDAPSFDDKRHHLSYEALTPLGGSKAQVRFRGRFQGRPVTWEAELMTLEEAWRQSLAGTGDGAQAATLRQFIDITRLAGDRLRVQIGLAVPAIDAPTVFKTMIMIHNYKRLRPGRHEYGPAHEIRHMKSTE